MGWKKALLPKPEFHSAVQAAYSTALHGLCRKRRQETETLLRQLSANDAYANQRDARCAVLHLDMVRHLNGVNVKAVQEALTTAVLEPQGANNARRWLHESAQGVDMKLRLAAAEALSFLELRRQWDRMSK